MMKKLNLWLEITRAYSLPMSIFSWFVVYCYSTVHSGNTLYGIIALAGICFVHMGINMLDDYIDYKTLPKKTVEGKLRFRSDKKNKCAYLFNGSITLKTLLAAIIVSFAAAIITGFFFIFKIGLGVLVFMLLGGLIGIIYPHLGKFRLCELAIFVIYGPLLFGGVNYVMLGHFDWHALIISIPSALLTVNLLYTDSLLDYDLDIKEGKKTLANIFDSPWKSLRFQRIIIGAAYCSVILSGLFDIVDWQIFLTWATLPMALNLMDSIKIFLIENSEPLEKRGYDTLMDNWEGEEKGGVVEFMSRMFQARNVMAYFSLIFGLILLLYS